MVKVLLAETNIGFQEHFINTLQSLGHFVDSVYDGEAISEKIASSSYDLVILDLTLPKKDALQILAEHQLNPSKLNQNFIVLTNVESPSLTNKFQTLGALASFTKSNLDISQVSSLISPKTND